MRTIEVVDIISYIIENLYIVVRLILALLLGGLIGKERGQLNRPAGIRTHMIVCTSSALIMLLGSFMAVEYPNIDITRLAAQVVSGIGFLGAGAILKDGFSVRGLTTAATLWVVACVGLAVGGGFYIGAILTTLLVYGSLKTWGTSSIKAKTRYIGVIVDSVDATVDEIKVILIQAGVHVSEIGVVETDNSKMYEVRFYCTIDKKTNTDNLVIDLMKISGVKFVHLE